MILTRRHADFLTESANEVALIAKPKRVRHLCVVLASAQHLLRLSDAEVALVVMRRDAHRTLESAQCVELVEMRMGGEHVQAQLLVVAGMDKVSHAADRTMGNDVADRLSVVDILAQDRVEKDCERLLLLKSLLRLRQDRRRLHHKAVNTRIVDHSPGKTGGTRLAAFFGGSPHQIRCQKPSLEQDVAAAGRCRDEIVLFNQHDVLAVTFVLVAAVVAADWSIASRDDILREKAAAAGTGYDSAAMDLYAGQCCRALDCVIGANGKRGSLVTSPIVAILQDGRRCR